MTDEVRQIGLDLGLMSAEVMELLLADEAIEGGFFTEVLNANRQRKEILNVLLTHYKTPFEIRAEVSGILRLPAPDEKQLALLKQKAEGAPEEERKQTLLTKIRVMSAGEKIQLAMRGSREVRNILIKDTNKEVVKTVMQNPKMTESEVELIAMNRNISEEILRTIGSRREWMKNYAVTLALVTNPKTPVGISMAQIPRIKKGDLVKFETNKNLPEAVRAAAKGFLAKQKKQR